jgi:Skp family chaperone for outer membrane proteins
MKRSLFTAALSLIAAAGFTLTTPAFAETNVGVVNIQKIMRDSKAANSVRAQLKEKQKSFQAELDAKEKALLAEDQSLVKQSNTTDKAAFQEKIKAFQSKAANAQREVAVKKQQLDKAFAGALEQIQTSVIAIVKEIAAQKKLNLVATSSSVLYNDAALDITAEVQQKLDAKLPTVKVAF